jgi:hypothetical protein
MRYNKVIKAEKALKRNKVFRIGMILSGILSLAFGVVTFYGQDSGNFIMSIDKEAYTRGIILSTDDSFEHPQSRLMTDPVEEARDLTYRWLKLDDIENANGNYSDPDFDYVAYTFYIKNDGNETVNVSYHIAITDVFKNMDEAVRVLVKVDDQEVLYQKEDQKDEQGLYPVYPPSIPEADYFLSDQIIVRATFNNFQPNEMKKISVVIWLEGYDPDTTDDMLGGMIKMEMIFSIENRS